jgi:tetratricopeptide (TPR) repeat protein
VGGGRLYYVARQYDAAINEYQGIIEMDPSYAPASGYLSWAYLQKGMYQEALDASQKSRDLSGYKGPLLTEAIIYAMSGREEKARAILAKVLENYSPKRAQPGWIAVTYAALGQKDEAFSWLEKAVEYYDSWLFMLQDPFWDPLRSDARFTALLKKMGIE